MWSLLNISLNSVPMETIDNKSAFVQVMAWHQVGEKSLYETMLTQMSGEPQ